MPPWPSPAPHVLVSAGLRKIALFIVLSPLIGLALGLLLTVAISWAFHRVRRRRPAQPRVPDRASCSRRARSASGHGANDAQKTMGVILALLIAAHHLPAGAGVPLWVVLSAHTAIALGTLTGGWRIVKTMGSKITRLQPSGGIAAETAAAATLFFTSAAGHPGVDHPHHHRRDRRRGGHPPALRGPLGRGRPASCGPGC